MVSSYAAKNLGFVRNSLITTFNMMIQTWSGKFVKKQQKQTQALQETYGSKPSLTLENFHIQLIRPR